MTKRILYFGMADIRERGGGSQATLAYFNAISSLYPNMVDVIMPDESLFQIPGSKCFGIPARSKIGKILGVIRGRVHRAYEFMDLFLQNNASKYSLLIINGGIYGDILKLSQKYHLKVVIIHHNFERQYHLDNKSLESFWGISTFLINRNERCGYIYSDINIFLTQDDLELFEEHYGERKNNYCIGIFEPDDNIPVVLNKIINTNICITGSLDTYQTLSGLKDFVNRYIDYVFKVLPLNSITFAGRNPNNFLYDVQHKYPSRVKIVPNPINIDSIIKDCGIFICPTNIGGGVKLRVMDGLRNNLCILVHEVSARGYEYFFNKPYFKVYNDNFSFESGLKAIIDFVGSNHDDNCILNDYVNYFSFQAGCSRLKNALEVLGTI